MVYLAMAGEADPVDLIARCWKDGKTVLVPKVLPDPRRIIAVEIKSLSQGLVVSKYGIREPADNTAFDLEKIDLVVVPGVGFGPGGGRLGRGGGYYDRFLTQPGLSATACGFGLVEQWVEDLPVLDHDARLNMLVTDRDVVRF
jgi:5-formyltetrahydrofolate cyclo-ligase